MPSQDLTAEQLRIIRNPAQEQSLVAIPYYDNQRNGTREVPISGGSVSDDGDASITREGTLTVPDSDGSWIPRDWADPLSPFGAQLLVFSQHKLTGSGTIRIPIGWFRVEEIPNYQEMKDRYRTGTWVHRGAIISVKMLGLFAQIDDDEFEVADQSPAAGGSTWSEIRRVANGFQITQSLADAGLPSKPITYETNRLDALSLLAANLGGVPYETADGTFSARPKIPTGDPVRKLSYGDAGGILTPPRSLSRKGFVNAMIVRNEQGTPAVQGTTVNPTGAPAAQIQGREIIPDGPLRWGGPMGRVPAKKNNPLVLNNDAARADARTELAKRRTDQTYQIEVSCLPDPTIIPGDIVAFDYFDETDKEGVVLKTTVPHNGLQKMTLQIQTGGNPWA